MRTRLLLLFMCTISAQAASYTLAANGTLWGIPAAWSPRGVPGDGDTVNIPDGMVVTLNESRTIGTSGENGTAAVLLNNSGKLIISAGGELTVRGDIVYTAAGCGNTGTAIMMQAGSTLHFDASLASAASSTHYVFRPDASGGCRPFVSTGTDAQRNTIDSVAGAGVGGFALPASPYATGGPFTATYTDFTNIGDASFPGWQVGMQAKTAVTWDVTYSTFTNCGTIASVDAGAGVADSGTFRHSYNVHSSTQGPEVFSRWINIVEMTGGIREIRNNVFDVSMSNSGFYLPGFTLYTNYFGGSTQTGGGPWARFQGNLIRHSDPAASPGYLTVTADMLDSFIFSDCDYGNPKPIGESYYFPANLLGIIYGQGGSSPVDSGELWWNRAQQDPQNIGIYNSIILPNMTGHASLEIGAVTGGMTKLTAIAEHNTWFGGWNGDTTQGQPGFPAVQVGEGGNYQPEIIGSFRSNILWNPQLEADSTGAAHEYRSSFFKLADLSYSANPITDYCLPANCDYNTGWGHTLIDTRNPQYTNQQKGYAAKFSSAPGVHDVDVNPQFLDYQRSLELFDSKYLGNHPVSWDKDATYSPGDMVSWSRQDIYWSLPVNYRYINTGSCDSANPEPGSGDHWRDCWEWASLYRIRQAISAGTTWDDPLIGASGSDVIITLIQWIRAGYSPTNPLLAGAAHDGTDIGAVPVSFTVTYQQDAVTGTSVRGGTIRGGKVR